MRTYKPGLDFERDDPTDHPLVMAERILRTEYRGSTGERGFERLLVDQARRHAAALRLDWDGLAFLEDARLAAVAVARAAASAPADRAARKRASASVRSAVASARNRFN